MHLNTIILLLLFSCGSGSKNFLTQKEYSELISQANTRLTTSYRGDSSELFRIYEDHGFAGRSYYLIKADNSDLYYRVDKDARYTGGLVWDGKIFQTCGVSIGPSHSGKFIEVRYFGPENMNKSYNYDTLNYRNLHVEDIVEEGVYRYDSIEFVKVGELQDFCEVKDFKHEGIYFLTYPGIFYQTVVDIDDLMKTMVDANKIYR